MKPFVVEYHFEAVVMAEDESAAYMAARDVFRDVVGDSDPDIDVGQMVTKESQLPYGRDDMCIPYNGDGNTRLREIISESYTEK